MDTGLAFVGDDAFHLHLWQLLLRRRIRVEIRFAEPMLPAPESIEARGQRAREQILAALG